MKASGRQSSTKNKTRLITALMKRVYEYIPDFSISGSAAAGTLIAATAASLSQINAGRNRKSEIGKINLDGFCLFQENLVNDKLVVTNFMDRVRIFWLIQSHCKRWSASTAFVQKDPYGRDLSVLEIFADLLLSRGRNFNITHHNLLNT